MIKIAITVDELANKITQIEVKGHSNKDAYGHDLVCAAVSAILTGGFNALSDKDVHTELKEGYALVSYKSLPSEYDAVVLKTMEVQLMTVQESEKQFINIEFFKKG